MSSKTNFKRLALVAVASLGLGVLSAVPSQAAVDSVTVSGTTAGTATTTVADSLTAASFTVEGFVNVNMDALRITLIPKTSNASAQGAYLTLVETTVAGTLVDTTLVNIYGGASTAARAAAAALVAYNPDGATRTTVDTVGVTTAGVPTGNFMVRTDTNVAAQARIGAKFRMQLDSQNVNSNLTAGTYTYTAVVRAYDASQSTVTDAKTQYVDLTITVSAPASASKVASAVNSQLFINTSASAASADVAVLGSATASATPIGYLTVKLRNASNTNSASESVTVTTTVGQVANAAGTIKGRSVVLAYSTDMLVGIYGDGTAGSATITVSTPSVTFATKTATFYGAAPTTIVASLINSVAGAGSTTAVAAVAKDSAGVIFGGTLYVYSGTVGTASNAGSSCSYNATNQRHECAITGVASGTTAITIRDAATVATSTVASNAVTATVSTAAPASLSMAWDKATYAPGEKATLTVTVLDSTGKPVSARAYNNLYLTGGITFSQAVGNGSASDYTTVSPTTAAPNLADPTKTGTIPVKTYTTYMPMNGGSMVATVVGGSDLPAAGQVAKTATATVTDNAAAALAAVNALATTVASLRTLITTLTNLVLKIQKKVQA